LSYIYNNPHQAQRLVVCLSFSLFFCKLISFNFFLSLSQSLTLILRFSNLCFE
jgi:hypothetical protein